MNKIVFPPRLEALLADSPLQPPIRDLANRVGVIISRNDMPFFPHYTDHGSDHINDVLKSAVGLIPDEVWSHTDRDGRKGVLTDADAAVLIGATLLHDIAMHIQPQGLLELVKPDSRFKPLPWFDKEQEGHSPDRAWSDLWDDYVREARKFSGVQLAKIVGEKAAADRPFTGLSNDPDSWSQSDKLVAGEFIRRHHARLGHEIAAYGFPGLPSGNGAEEFPRACCDIDSRSEGLSDLIGLAARSHWLSLRVCWDYLVFRWGRTPRPLGAAALYPMALLRVSDYLQIDKKRAPSVLLRLQQPQSPKSVEEWLKHEAVQSVDAANDPRGVYVSVSDRLPLLAYLQLEELLAGLQAEIDHATSVLDEAYGRFEKEALHLLDLSIIRVHSNLNSPAFRSRLPYVPKKTGFTSAPQLLKLLVEPLYGNEPGVGIRELVQNSVDAVREVMAWRQAHPRQSQALQFPSLDCDVEVEFRKLEDRSWRLTVTDCGIGMSASTLQDYFMCAGASFRESSEWMREFSDSKGNPRVVRSGRFGIGAFAVFLLGEAFEVRTRLAGSPPDGALTLQATSSADLIEIRRERSGTCGTRIEVCLSKTAVSKLSLEDAWEGVTESLVEQVEWYCCNQPIVRIFMADSSSPPKRREVIVHKPVPHLGSELSARWHEVKTSDFTAIHWRLSSSPSVFCNGFRIGIPNGPKAIYTRYGPYFRESRFGHRKGIRLSIWDKAGTLPLNIQRSDFGSDDLSFRKPLWRDMMLSVLAHALVSGPTTPLEALSGSRLYPLHPLTFWGLPHFGWCCNSASLVLLDSTLVELLNSDSLILIAGIGNGARAPSRLDESLDLLADLVLQERVSMARTWLDAEFSDVSSLGDVLSEVVVDLYRGAAEGIVDQEVSLFYSKFATLYRHRRPEHRGSVWEMISRADEDTAYVGEKGRVRAGYRYGDIGSAVFKRVLETLDPLVHTAYLCAELREVKSHGENEDLSKLWLEFIGREPIPFDPSARAELIRRASQNVEFRRHIEDWESLKRSPFEWDS